MSGRMDKIMRLIEEEAREKPGNLDDPSKLYTVLLEVHSLIRERMIVLRDAERAKAKREGGE